MDMSTAINKLIDSIKGDYLERFGNSDSSVRDNMVKEFNDNIRLSEGKKYIKIISNNSVWGFVVNTDNDAKFSNGDILMAAGWKTPARNHARGNVFGDYEVRWTGPNYLR